GVVDNCHVHSSISLSLLIWFMDQGITALVLVGGGQVEHTQLPIPCRVVAARVIVGDDDFLVLTACLLGHAVGSGGVEDVKLLIQLHDIGAVVVGHHDVPFAI